MHYETALGRLVPLLVAALALAACGGNSEQLSETPGEGVEVTIARPTWSTGWFQAEIYANLLRRLGYEVNEPGELEVTEDQFYSGAARGEIDLWAHGWFPQADVWLEEVVDGVGRTGDLVEAVGNEVPDGALQGILIDKATATREGIRSLGDIVADPSLRALFDSDGNGRAEILGCQPDWTCAADVDELVGQAGGEALEQIVGNYDGHVDVALNRIDAEKPVLLFTWTPNHVVQTLDLGTDALWLDTSPAGAPDSTILEHGTCTATPCRMGWTPNDIRVVANSQFLAENPAAAALLDVVEIPAEDITRQNVAMEQGDDTPADIALQAEQWLGERRGLILDWLRAARRAAATP